MTAPTTEIEIRDVTLRDGLQLTGKMISAERKLEIVRRLFAAGVPSVEVGSMARADLVPSMANTPEVLQALTVDELARSWVWVATPRHVRAAAECGAVNFQYCLSVSTSHNAANLGRTTEASLDAMPEAVRAAADVDGRTQLCLATAFTCPFEGSVDPELVLKIACDPRTEGATDIIVCDTMGQATPSLVRELIGRVLSETPQRRVGFHPHDTWGSGLANAEAAVHAGATIVDATLSGLGGCPFAPGAGGNLSLEDLVFASRPSWLTPSTFHDLVEMSHRLAEELQEPIRSKSAIAARLGSSVFSWSISSDGSLTDAPPG